jgi:hypothetical protein
LKKERTLKDVFYRSAFVDGLVDCAVKPKRTQLQLQMKGGDQKGAAAAGTRCSRPFATFVDPPIATLRDHIHFLISLLAQLVNALEHSPEHIFDHIDKIGGLIH